MGMALEVANANDSEGYRRGLWKVLPLAGFKIAVKCTKDTQSCQTAQQPQTQVAHKSQTQVKSGPFWLWL